MAKKPGKAPAPPGQGDVAEKDTTVAAWLSAIDRAQKDMSDWGKRCAKIRKRYRYESSTSTRRRQFQMLWSNQEIMRPAVYAKPPKPVVESRFKDGDPLVRITSQALERSLEFQADFLNYDRAFGLVRDDFLLYGRGVPRVRYYPVLEEAEIPTGLDEGAGDEEAYDGGQGAEAEADEEGAEVLKIEHVCVDFVQRDDFIHPQARTWEELPWLCYRAFLDREQLIDRFGEEIGKAIPLDTSAGRSEADSEKKRQESAVDKATIYEIWDKANTTVLWIAKGYGDKVLEEGPPYLKLNGFYPSPRPAYGTLTTDSLIPVPDYVYYQDQAEEIDDLTARIASLSDSLKVVGFYPAGPQGEGSPEIETAVKPGFENRMIAVKSWAMFKEGANGGVPIVFLPVDQVEQVLRGCVELRKQLIDDVYQITGISDILRGASEASETLGAQQLKAQWGGIRMRDRQAEVARLARDTVRMVSEVMCQTFQPETLLLIANMKLPRQADVEQAKLQASMAQQQWAQAAQVAQEAGQQPPEAPPQVPDLGPTVEDFGAFLKDQVLTRFRVDIEVDSTINADESQEKQDRTEFIQATSMFIGQWGPIIQANPEAGPLAGQLLLFGVRAYRTARQLEGAIEQFVEKMEQSLAQPKQPQVDPVVQAKLDQAKQEGANSQQLHQQTMDQNAQKHAQDMDQAKQEGAIKLDLIRAQAQASAQEHRQNVELKGHDVEKARVTTKGQQDQHMFAREAHQQTMAQGKQAHEQTLESGKQQHSQTLEKGNLDITQAKEGHEIKKNEASHAASIRESEARTNHELKGKDEERKAKAAEKPDAVSKIAKELMDALKAAGEDNKKAYADIAELIKKPKKITVGKRGPDNRISEAEIA
jgi:hypothetical protein